VSVRLRPSRPDDLAFITSLERDAENRKIIGQWSDGQHLAAMRGEGGRWHSIIERDGERAGYIIGYDSRAASGGGVYLKRVLVGDKERGTGKAAVRCFLDETFARLAPDFIWLHVYEWNARARAVYLALGFRDYHPPHDEAERLDAAAEGPAPQAHRMRIDAAK
jgi:ribosomal protein S18 acetylase RimI-like enzyme